MLDVFVGVDGGGTSCRAAVAGADGRILGRGRSGAANILTDPDLALVHIAQASAAAFVEAGLDPALIASVPAVLGLAGNNVKRSVHYVKARLPFARAEIVSDVLIALQGALGDEDGAVASLGTGTVYVARRNGRVETLGGHGFHVGDLGSGARLGQMLLAESLLAHDRIRAGSPLTDTVLREFEDRTEAVIDFAHHARPVDFARYAPRIFDAAARGDPVGERIVRSGAACIDETLDRLVADGVRTICLVGGLAPLYRPFLSMRPGIAFVAPADDALAGSAALAVKRFAGAEAKAAENGA